MQLLLKTTSGISGENERNGNEEAEYVSDADA